MDKQDVLEYYRAHKGQLATHALSKLEDADDLSLAYTPGVAQPCREIAADQQAVWDYTLKDRTVAIVTDGSAVLGLGNIGAHAAIPVMEGKAVLLNELAGIDAFPLALDTQDADELVETIVRLAPSFGAINLEDIAAPRCFAVEQALKDRLDVPVFHDDQHGTAIVALAALKNALSVTGRKFADARVVVSGAGAAGNAITQMLLSFGVQDVVVCDSKGALYPGRADMNSYKQELARTTNVRSLRGSLSDVLVDADAFIGVSAPGVIGQEDVRAMADDPIVFALANPDPEISPDQALAAGAGVVATGRSDHKNQINNVLAFPGVFKGVMQVRASQITEEMKCAGAHALADLIERPSREKIIPGPFDEGVVDAVAQAVAAQARKDGVDRA